MVKTRDFIIGTGAAKESHDNAWLQDTLMLPVTTAKSGDINLVANKIDELAHSASSEIANSVEYFGIPVDPTDDEQLKKVFEQIQQEIANSAASGTSITPKGMWFGKTKAETAVLSPNELKVLYQINSLATDYNYIDFSAIPLKTYVSNSDGTGWVADVEYTPPNAKAYILISKRYLDVSEDPNYGGVSYWNPDSQLFTHEPNTFDNTGTVKYDVVQSLSEAQKLQARENIGAGNGGGGYVLGRIYQNVFGEDLTRCFPLDGGEYSINGVLSTEFINLLREKKGIYHNLCFDTVDDWNNASLLNVAGDVGAFVLDDISGIIKFPRITEALIGVTTIDDLGSSIPDQAQKWVAGFYRRDSVIPDTIDGEQNTATGGGLVTSAYNNHSGNGDTSLLKIDPSTTIRTGDRTRGISTRYPFYICVSTEGQTESVSVDINNVLYELNRVNSELEKHKTFKIDWTPTITPLTNNRAQPAYTRFDALRLGTGRVRVVGYVRLGYGIIEDAFAFTLPVPPKLLTDEPVQTRFGNVVNGFGSVSSYSETNLPDNSFSNVFWDNTNNCLVVSIERFSGDSTHDLFTFNFEYEPATQDFPVGDTVWAPITRVFNPQELDYTKVLPVTKVVNETFTATEAGILRIYFNTGHAGYKSNLDTYTTSQQYTYGFDTQSSTGTKCTENEIQINEVLTCVDSNGDVSVFFIPYKSVTAPTYKEFNADEFTTDENGIVSLAKDYVQNPMVADLNGGSKRIFNLTLDPGATS